MPGVVVKATKSGPIVGYALEAYTANDIGKIQVFVNTGWWGGAPLSANGSLNISPETAGSISNSSTSAINATSTPKEYQGIARILPGGTHVHVMHPTLGSFPLIQVTPYGMIEGGWWTDHSSDVGFDIYLKAPLGHDATFSWRAEEMLPSPPLPLPLLVLQQRPHQLQRLNQPLTQHRQLLLRMHHLRPQHHQSLFQLIPLS